MRIRLQLLPPFEESKALVLLPLDVQTILGLRRHLRHSLSTVLALTTSPKDLLLEIDGFELLPGSSIDVIEPADVVTVRLRAGSSKQELGVRKRSASREDGEVKKRKLVNGEGSIRATAESASVPLRAASPAVSTSSPSSSSTSASSSETASSTDSSSSSNSSSSSSSSSSSDSAPAFIPNPPFPLPPPSLKLSAGRPMEHVIPGQGKISTKERNQRRKIARRMQKQAEQNGLADGDSTKAGESQAAVPVSMINGEGHEDTITSIQSELPVPRAMANRNKKKGFLKEMANVQGTKTVFGTDAQASSTPLNNHQPDTSTIKSTPDATPHRSATWDRSRIVPPSELEVLPSNVFVTHVEYQRNGWTPRQRNQRGGQNVALDVSTDQHHEVADIDGEEDVDEEEFLNDSTALDSGDISHIQLPVPILPSNEADEDVWAIADSRIDILPSITAGSMPTQGTVLAWKELQLDPYTFSPQLVVQLGTLKALTSESAVIERIQRYEAEDEEDQVNGMEPELVINLSDLHKEAGKYKIAKQPT